MTSPASSGTSRPPAGARILITLTYYWPHISGLTLYAKRLAEGLAERGYDVRLLTSRYDPNLAESEDLNGVQVHRSRVLLRLNKGVIMPAFLLRCFRACHEVDIVNLHLPQIEAALVAIYARLIARKLVYTTYHCDLELPPGIAQVVFSPFMKVSHLLTVMFSNKVIANSEDYVTNSRFLRHFRSRIVISYPPCAKLQPSKVPPPLDISRDAVLLGFVGRFAEEKGVEYIIGAMPRVLEAYPNAVFAFAGEVDAWGEQVYRRFKAQIEAFGDSVRILGVLPEPELAAFYERCNLLLLPSVNSTESFGMVQIEAMYSGVPVIAGDIAGVRVPVAETGMGRLVPPRDSAALAEAILIVLADREAYVRPSGDLMARFGVERALDFYEDLFGVRESLGVSLEDAGTATSP
jgi:glycosyltransferase involved in cell wall biosynthesis